MLGRLRLMLGLGEPDLFYLYFEILRARAEADLRPRYLIGFTGRAGVDIDLLGSVFLNPSPAPTSPTSNTRPSTSPTSLFSSSKLLISRRIIRMILVRISSSKEIRYASLPLPPSCPSFFPFPFFPSLLVK